MTANPFINPQAFLTENWQKKPCLLPAAISGFSNPVSTQEMRWLAEEPLIEARCVKRSPDGLWLVAEGPFESDALPQPQEPNWTLLIQAVDHWLPNVQQLLQHFRWLPSWRLDDIMVSLSNTGGGVGPHYDQYDVFLIQAQGTRTWQVGPLCDENTAMKVDGGLKQLQNMTVVDTHLVVPGDILYLPPGVSHDGIATSDDCITISVGFRAPAHGEILTDFFAWQAERTLDRDRFSDANRPMATSPHEITAWDIENLKNVIARYAEDGTQLRQWLGSHMTEPKYPELMPEDLGHSLGDWQEALGDADWLCVEPASRIAFDADNLYIDARMYSRQDAELSLQTLLLEKEALAAQQALALFGRSTGQDQLLLSALNQGTLYIA